MVRNKIALDGDGRTDGNHAHWESDEAAQHNSHHDCKRSNEKSNLINKMK
jgi:hypothetical protein